MKVALHRPCRQIAANESRGHGGNGQLSRVRADTCNARPCSNGVRRKT